MKTSALITTISLLGTLSITSCQENINSMPGDWTPMKWNCKEADKCYDKQKHAYIIPAEGGDLHFVCKNYKAPWLCGATIQRGETTVELPDSASLVNWDWHTIEYKDYRFTFSHDSLQVHIGQNGEQECTINLCVTAGDIFDEFRFLQKAAH